MKAICKKCKFKARFSNSFVDICKNENNTMVIGEYMDYVNGKQYKEKEIYGYCIIKNNDGECPFFEEKENFVVKLKRLKCLLFTTIAYLYNRVIFNFKS